VLTDFLPPEEIEAKFRKRFGTWGSATIWAGLGLIALGVVAYFWGLKGPAGEAVFEAGRPPADVKSVLSQRYPGLTFAPGRVDLWRPLMSHGGDPLLSPRWWRMARFNPDARVAALRDGITTVVTTGDPLDWSVTLAKAIRDGRLAGPDVVPAAIICRRDRLRAWEPGAAIAIGGVPPFAAHLDPAAGLSGAPDAVRQGIKQGAEILAIDALTEIRPTPAEIASMCATARALGKRAVVLAVSPAAVLEGAEAGAAAIAGSPVEELPDLAMAKMRAKGIVFAPAVAAAGDAARPLVAANAIRAHGAGVRLALATVGRPIHEELAALARTGISPAALRAFGAAGASALATPPKADHVGMSEQGAVNLVVSRGRAVTFNGKQ